MKTLSPQPLRGVRGLRQKGSAKPVLLVIVFFCLGIGVSAFWFSRHSTGPSAPAATTALSPGLSESTRAVLQRLDSPVELRFYSLLDPTTVPESVRAFAGRVNQLLAAYEQAGKGRIKVTRVDSPSNAAANSALADGLKPFNQDKGDACFLGIAVVRGDKKESLAQLAPDWEPALESDLSRAIAHLNESSVALKPAPAAAPIDPAVEEEVKRALPNLATISVEEGTQVLRKSALEELNRTAQELDARVKEAQQRFLEAEKNQSAADQETARQQIQQLQAQQTEALKQIIAKSQARIELFQRLKAGGQ
jgi:hypothetical protein